MGCGERRKTMELPRRRASGAPGACPMGEDVGAVPAARSAPKYCCGGAGAHRILTRRPSVSATFMRTAGTGSFRSRLRAARSRAGTCRGLRGHGRSPRPQAGTVPGAKPQPGFPPGHRKVKSLCPPGAPHQPLPQLTHPRGGRGTLKPLGMPPPGAHSAETWPCPRVRGQGSTRGPLLQPPGEGKGPSTGVWGWSQVPSLRGSARLCRRWPGQASPISTIS